MSQNGDGPPNMPPGIDPVSGAALLGTQAYGIFDRTLTLEPGQLTPSQMWDRGFMRGPWGQPQVHFAVAATWCYAAMGFSAHQQQIAELYQIANGLQAQINAVGQLTLDVVQNVRALVDELDADNDVTEAIKRELEDLKGAVVIVKQPPDDAVDAGEATAKPAPKEEENRDGEEKNEPKG